MSLVLKPFYTTIDNNILNTIFFFLVLKKSAFMHAKIFPTASGSLSLKICPYALLWLIVPLWMRVAQRVFQGRHVAKIGQKKVLTPFSNLNNDFKLSIKVCLFYALRRVGLVVSKKTDPHISLKKKSKELSNKILSTSLIAF